MGAALLALAASPTAFADIDLSAVSVSPAKTKTVSIASAKKRDCRNSYDAGTRGVSLRRWTAPSDGYLTVRLRGKGSTNDWDLSLFAPSGRRLATSAAFRANEVVQSYVRSGQVIGIQTCRLSGRSKRQPMSTTFARFNLGISKLAGAVAPKQSLVRISVNSRRDLDLLQQLGFDLGEDATPTSVSAVLHSTTDRLNLLKAGFQFKTVIADLAAQDRRDRAADAAYAARVGKSPTPTGRTTYRTYDDIQAELKKLIADYPGVVKGVQFPHKTFQGRDMQAIEIAQNVNAADDNRPTFLVVGTHHAREWPAAEMPMEFAWYLVKNQSDPRVARILKNTRIVIEPVINADGYVNSRSYEALDPDANNELAGVVYLGTQALGLMTYRRKTCQGPFPSPAVPCDIQLGVDPNRNYGQFWGGPGASSDPTSLTYRGPSPWSEPETQSVHEWSRSHDVTTLITLHNVAALVLRPPGLHTQGLAPEEQQLKKLGDQMAKGTGYTSQYGWQLYDTTGTTEDWNYAAAGTFGYTIEIGPLNGNFHQAYETGVIDQWTGGTEDPKTKGKGMKEALLLAAENSFNKPDHATFTGRAPAGRVLHLRKTFTTDTSDVCLVADIGPLGQGGCNLPSGVQQIPDFLDYTTVVPKSGKFSWIITPSTRPFVRKKGGVEAWTLTCEDSSKKVIQTEQLIIGVGQTVKKDLPCGGKLPKAKKKSKKKKRKR
jgi:zinc carboxypeptidase